MANGGSNNSPIVFAVLGGAVIIAGAMLIDGCSQRALQSRNADADHIFQAINTDPVQAAKNLRFLISAELVGKQQRDKLANLLATIQYRHGPAIAPMVAGSQCTPPSDARVGLVVDWLNIECGYWFPTNDGFDGKPKTETLTVGTQIDRYGSPYGTFLAPTAATYEQRALPYEKGKKAYHRYEVTKPLIVSAGPIARWFDEPGGGTQYKTSKPVQQLIDEGYLKEIRN